MWDFLGRTALVVGQDALDRLRGARVALLGLGGVGGAAAEALCRLGVGRLLLVDHDVVEESNLNRQILATRQVLGQPKTQAARRRLASISPGLVIETAETFYLPEESDFLYDWRPDLVLDATDTVSAKLHLARECEARGIPLISAMGTGNRLDPSRLRLGDVWETAGNGCPLARIMRRELRRRGVEHLLTVYSQEPPLRGLCAGEANGRHSPGSTALVPPAAGYLMAYGAFRVLTGDTGGLLPGRD